MAKIVSSELAPSEAVHYTFDGVEFDLGPRKKAYETDNAAVLSNAETHPWLTVERDTPELVQGAYVEQIAAADDPLSVVGQPINPNDPDEARKAEAAKADATGVPLAVQAGLDQTEPVVTSGVPETLAAADAPTDEKDKS